MTLRVRLSGPTQRSEASIGGSGRVDHRGEPAALALFLNGQQDTINIPAEFINIAAPNGKPRLRSRSRNPSAADAQSDVVVTYFNMDDRVVGGYTPESGTASRDQPWLQHRGGNPYGPPRCNDRRAIAGAAADVVYDEGSSARWRVCARERAARYLWLRRSRWRRLAQQPDGSPPVLDGHQSSQIDRAFNEM
jgi:hypothetical protein